MSHATVPAPAHPVQATGFRIAYHPLVCPGCASDEVITEDVETGDGLTEAAQICRCCGTAWPVACVSERRATLPAARRAGPEAAS
jgi:hypothetical protein